MQPLKTILKLCSHLTFSSVAVTGDCFNLQCIPISVVFPDDCKALLLQCGRGRFRARNFSHWSFFVAQISYCGCAEVFRDLFWPVSFTSQSLEVDREVSLPCFFIGFNFVIFQKSCTLIKQVQWEHSLIHVTPLWHKAYYYKHRLFVCIASFAIKTSPLSLSTLGLCSLGLFPLVPRKYYKIIHRFCFQSQSDKCINNFKIWQILHN